MSVFEKLADLRERQQKTIVQGQRWGLDEPVSRFDGEFRTKVGRKPDHAHRGRDLTGVQAAVALSIDRERPFPTVGQSPFGVRDAGQ